jgi:hypothetical protein
MSARLICDVAVRLLWTRPPIQWRRGWLCGQQPGSFWWVNGQLTGMIEGAIERRADLPGGPSTTGPPSSAG